MTSTFDMADIVFINFVASSATNEGWPIEVGIAWIADDAVQSWSSVIRPEPHWTSGWSANIIEAGGIPENDLFGGPSDAVVARSYVRRIHASGKIPVSEADEWDATMARKRLATIGAWPGLIVNSRTFVAFANRRHVDK